MVLDLGRLRRAASGNSCVSPWKVASSRSLRWQSATGLNGEEMSKGPLCDRGENQGRSGWGSQAPLGHLSGQHTRFQDGCLFQASAPPTPVPRTEQKAQRTVKKGKAQPRRSVLLRQLCPLAFPGLAHRGSGWKQPRDWPRERSPVTTT